MLCLALPLLALPGSLTAQTGSPAAPSATSPEAAKRALDAKKTDLDGVEAKAKTIAQDVESLRAERERLTHSLVETGALIQKSEGRLTAIESRAAELDAQEKLLRGSLDSRRGQIAKLLSALLRMGRNPPPVMVTRREDALQMVRSAMLLAAAFPELRTQALGLAERLNELVGVMTQMHDESEKLKAETQHLVEARTRLAGLMDAKRLSLTERRAELDEVRRQSQAIAKSVTDLSELIAQSDSAVAKSTTLGAYENEIRKAPPAAAPPAAAPTAKVAAEPAPPPTSHSTTATADAGAQAPGPEAAVPQPKSTQVASLTLPRPAGPAYQLEPGGDGRSLGHAGPIKPAIPFELAHARLPMPAHGRRVLAFGDKTQYGGFSKGIVIETRLGGQITSPCDGWVVHAGEFRSYGQLLIINAGGGYHVLLAGMSQIDVQPGQFVLAAEPIGLMGGSPVAGAGKGQSSPVLYIEFRKDGRPVDPNPWWVQDGRTEAHAKVQG